MLINSFINGCFRSWSNTPNAKISDDAQKATEVEMRRFVGVMFAMTICPMSNIKGNWNIKDDGLMLASRFYEKLHMSGSK